VKGHKGCIRCPEYEEISEVTAAEKRFQAMLRLGRGIESCIRKAEKLKDPAIAILLDHTLNLLNKRFEEQREQIRLSLLNPPV